MPTTHEARFARRLHEMRWLTQSLLSDSERAAVTEFVQLGLVEEATLDRRAVVRFTAAGETWCRENGIG
jgi:hypothetical protein